MTKKEKQELANRCGYEYIYSGKTKTGFFKEIEGTENVQVSDEDSKALSKLIAQENK